MQDNSEEQKTIQELKRLYLLPQYAGCGAISFKVRVSFFWNF